MNQWPIIAANAAVLAGLMFCMSPAGCGATKPKESAMPDDKTKPSPTTMPPLTAEEQRVILHKGTERAFTGKYWNTYEKGVYVCRQCGAELYRSTDKFKSECGWPSFDDEIPGAVHRQLDADGQRMEITCAKCDAHLGHVFLGEGMTPKNTRHCVNSVSLEFRPATQPAATRPATEEATFAGGCFWGVESHFDHMPGVISATSGYSGGTVANPTYKQVCTGKTGHAESVKIVYDPSKVTYEQVARKFLEIHDPTTLDSQGPDHGTQYRSAIFYKNDEQKKIAEKLIAELKAKGYKVVTEVAPAKEFYPAEDYHQDYFDKHPGHPTCHIPTKRFEVPFSE